MSINKYFAPIFLSILLLSGCSFIDSFATKAGYEKKTKVENQILVLKQEREQALKEQEQKLTYAQNGLLEQVRKNFQETTNWVYGAFLGSELIQNKNRLDTVINLRLKTALSFSPGPTPEAIIEQNRLLQEELDESRVTNAELTKRYNEKDKEAREARLAEANRVKEIENLQAKIAETEKGFQAKIDAKQNELNGVNNQLIELERFKVQKLKEGEHLKRVMMGWLFAGASICAVGAHFFRAWELALAAIICAGTGIAIPFIETWMVVSGLCGIGTLVGIVIYNKFNKEKNIANRAVGAIQEVRNESEEVYSSKIKPKLVEWFQDAKHLEAKVEAKLKELNVK